MNKQEGLGKPASIFSIPKKEVKLSFENSVAQVVELLAYYDYDINAIEDAKEKSGVEKQLKDMARFYMDGRFENRKNEDGAPIVVQHLFETPGTLKEITYQEFTGNIRVASGDGIEIRKDTFNMAYKMLEGMSGMGTGIRDKLRGADLKAAEALGNLFFLLMS